jgi:hypothetical protein
MKKACEVPESQGRCNDDCVGTEKCPDDKCVLKQDRIGMATDREVARMQHVVNNLPVDARVRLQSAPAPQPQEAAPEQGEQPIDPRTIAQLRQDIEKGIEDEVQFRSQIMLMLDKVGIPTTDKHSRFLTTRLRIEKLITMYAEKDARIAEVIEERDLYKAAFDLSFDPCETQDEWLKQARIKAGVQ